MNEVNDIFLCARVQRARPNTWINGVFFRSSLLSLLFQYSSRKQSIPFGNAKFMQAIRLGPNTSHQDYPPLKALGTKRKEIDAKWKRQWKRKGKWKEATKKKSCEKMESNSVSVCALGWWVLIEWANLWEIKNELLESPFSEWNANVFSRISSHSHSHWLLAVFFCTFFMLKLTFAAMQECSSCTTYMVVKKPNQVHIYTTLVNARRKKACAKTPYSFWFCEFSSFTLTFRQRQQQKYIAWSSIGSMLCFFSVTPNWIELLISISPANELKITFWIYLNSNTLKNFIFSPNKKWLSNVICIRRRQLRGPFNFKRSFKRKYHEHIKRSSWLFETKLDYTCIINFILWINAFFSVWYLS